VSQTWVGTDGRHIVINTVPTHQKVHNIRRDDRVAVGLADPARPMSSWAVRGRVVSVTEDESGAHINALSQKYLGRDYPGFGAGTSRLVLTIDAEKVHRPSR